MWQDRLFEVFSIDDATTPCGGPLDHHYGPSAVRTAFQADGFGPVRHRAGEQTINQCAIRPMDSRTDQRVRLIKRGLVFVDQNILSAITAPQRLGLRAAITRASEQADRHGHNYSAH